ncbi:MAG: hypothetical protein QM758_27240 [Armatimonas sp.]
MPLLHVEQERMHARLEQYLVEAEAGLKSLTPAEPASRAIGATRTFSIPDGSGARAGSYA